MKASRNRIHYFVYILLAITLGLVSRTSFIPKMIYPYIGDVIYCMMFFFVFGFLFPKLSSIRIALLAIGWCYLIEFTQLYQADWINQIRHTKLGGLILGFGFLWSDLISYLIGGFVGYAIETRLILRNKPSYQEYNPE